ncbi:serine/threonine-protein phosphatase CPPED1-like isoform X2 [Uloborus diversus]|uniref:serine/threonine-protein phosphatase CPPED1-like isoform X2 n=1 Tax=Uloborus diversus TaxID=327109 RepID=UPI00240A0797|nr:serine/threonine-protein phosphatase CPPED1-like isoform X2 [Uloborus diversus]
MIRLSTNQNHVIHFFSIQKMQKIELLRKAESRKYLGFDKEDENAWKGPFCFIQGADTQFGMISSYIKHESLIVWEKEMELAREAIKAINAMSPKPRFFVVCGDLIDAMPGNKYRNAQIEDFKRVFTELDPEIPLVCVCGNHDIGNQPTPATVADYREKFGDDYFSFVCGGVLFIVINSQFYEDPSLVQDLAKEQNVWLEKKLEEGKSGKYKHVIMFQHIPWFLREHDEPKEYFNIEPQLRQEMLKKFYDANVRAIFCGHYHRNAGGFYKDLECVVTSAIGCQLGDDKSGFRVVKLDGKSINHKYYAFAEVPKHISFD